MVAGAHHASDELDVLAAEHSVRIVTVDLAEPSGPEQLVAAAGGGVDILVNNVGGAGTRTEGFLAVTDAQWQASLELNFLVAVRTTRQVLPLMLDAGRGSIVNIASVNARLPDPAVIDYSAAKAALLNFSKSLSKEFGGRGVRVNAISPGPVATALWLGGSGVAATVAHATGMNAQDVVDQAARQSVTGCFTEPQEVADLVVVLASDRTGNVTGSEFTIDGGLVTTL